MAALSALLAAALLAAPASAAPKNPDTLVYAQFWGFDSLDPAWTPDMSPLFNLYEPLVDFRGAGTRVKDLEPVLASAVPSRRNGLLSPDGLTYRFPIREGVRFHDGAVMTPEDVRYSLMRFLLTDPAGGPAAALLEPVLGVSSTRRDGKPIEGLGQAAAQAVTADRDSVTVRLKKPFAPFLMIVANFGRVVSRKWAVAHGQWDGDPADWERSNNPGRAAALPETESDGTGPFRVERSDSAGRQMLLARHDGYWRGPAKLARVILKEVPDAAARRLMLQNGDADVVGAAPTEASLLSAAPGIVVTGGLRKLQDSAVLLFNVRVSSVDNPELGSGRLDGRGIPPDFFSDKDVRRAFAYAVDADAYIREALRGQGAPGSLIPPGLAGHRDRPPRYAFDPKKAEALFRAARDGQVWDKGFTVTLTVPPFNPQHLPLAQIVKRGVEALNPRFHVEIKTPPKAAFAAAKAAHRMPLALGSWTADYPDPHDFAAPMVRSGGAFSGLTGYSNPKADALVDEAAATLDEARRAKLYECLQDLVDEDLPFLTVADAFQFRVQRAWVRGFVFNPARHNLPYDSFYYDLSKRGD